MAEIFPITADGQFCILEQLGEGGYGSVYLVQHSTWGEVVLKKLRDRNNIGADDLDILRHEADILKNLRHPNIVTIYEGQFDRELCGLFLEHVKYGSVDSFLEQFSVSVEWKMQIIYDIASAMTYLHDRQPPIIHGDLKCPNVLIGNEFHAKICDFGLARVHTISKSFTENPLKGTLEYIPPEYFSDPRKRKTEKFDVYSYAILVWEISGMLGLEAWPRPRGQKTWPRPRPRPRGLWPRPRPRPRGVWPRPRGFWPRASRPLEAYSRNGTECDWK